MKKLFLKFRSCIENSFHNLNQPNGSISPEAIAALPGLKRELITGIDVAVMGMGKSGYVQRCLYQLQKGIVKLMDFMFKLPPQEKKEMFYTLAFESLTEIMASLRFNNLKYFNLEQAIPLYHREEVATNFGVGIPQLKAAMKLKKIDPELIDVVLQPYLSFNQQVEISYNCADYLQVLMERVIVLLKTKEGNEAALIKMLLGGGFNTNNFEQYLMLKISEEVYANPRLEYQYDCLYQYERLLTVLPKKPKGFYDLARGNSCTIVLRFVTAEIYYLNRKKELWSAEQTITPVAKDFASYRIKTFLSVDRLAYLLRLLVECEVVDGNPRSELLSFIAGHVETLNKSNSPLSEKSLKNKYKQVTQHTADTVRAMLARMIRQIDEDFV